MPAQSACGAVVRMEVHVRRLREEAQPLTLRADIQTPAFVSGQSSHELLVELLEISPQEEAVLPYYLTAQTTPVAESVLLADSQGIQVRVGDMSRFAKENFALRVAVIDATAAQIIDQAVASASLEMRVAVGGQDCVPLAEIVLQRTRSAYLIEELRTIGVRQYVRTAAGAPLREQLEVWFRSTAVPTPGAAPMGAPREERERALEPIYATGVCEVPLGANMRRGQTAYSDEIVHGLGPGTVYVSVGLEYLANDPKLGTSARNTIYGNIDLFREPETSAPSVETAVKVMNDRGSFVVAARLLEDSTQVILPLRWVAVMLPASSGEGKIMKMAGKSIAAMQPTIVLATRETCFFNVRFNNMEPCTLNYELTEKDSGEITSDGIYTAPGREGVFEIRISCAEMPLITTYAYAVVKKRDTQQAE
jgi:hypothetical protein